MKPTPGRQGPRSGPCGPTAISGADAAALIQRRALLRAALGVAAMSSGLGPPARSHNLLGRVNPPQLLPGLRVVSIDGRQTELAGLLQGKVCALQLMFTGCSATCPIQGAVFAELQRQLNSAPRRTGS